MKIYFAGSIRGGRSDQEVYLSIIKELEKYGTVLNEHIGARLLTDQGEINITDKEIFERDLNWIKESDLVVAEVTVPSLGVGYEIGQAQSIGKKIVCLYRTEEGKKLSGMISGNSYLNIYKYKTFEDLKGILADISK